MISNNSCKKLQETANTPPYLQKELLIVFVVDLRLFVFKIYSILIEAWPKLKFNCKDNSNSRKIDAQHEDNLKLIYILQLL